MKWMKIGKWIHRINSLFKCKSSAENWVKTNVPTFNTVPYKNSPIARASLLAAFTFFPFFATNQQNISF